jgi:cyanophycinase
MAWTVWGDWSRFVRAALLFGLLLCSGLIAQARGEEPAATLESIDPAGIGGTLVLCGRDVSGAQFLGSGEQSDAPLVVIAIGQSSVPALGDAVRRRFRAGSITWASEWSDVPWEKLDPPEGATAWLPSDSAAPKSQEGRAKLVAWVRRVWSNEGTVVVSGKLVAELGEYRCGGDPSSLSAGLGLVPGTVIRTAAETEDDAAPALTTPGRIQMTLDPSGVVALRGRRLSIPLAEVGGATLKLPESGERPRVVRIDRTHPADLVILRRAAVLRGDDSFPPHECPVPCVAKGSLVIVGGGSLPQPIIDRFVELAGGAAARIVVVPTAGEERDYDDHRDVQRLRDAGAGDVCLLHTRDRSAARSDEFLAPLRNATGVWFPGGRQWRLVDAYEGTPFVEECHGVLERVGVIGGTSAGATIQGELLVRGHPLGNEVMLAEGYERGFAFLPGTAIDQHFSQRGRESDLEEAKRTHPQFACLGIDEGTALVVTGSVAEVLGPGTVTVLDAPVKEGEPDISRTVLKSGDRYDFGERAVLE